MSYVRHACNIGSVYHCSVVRGCVPVSWHTNANYLFELARTRIIIWIIGNNPVLSITSGFSNTITRQWRITTTEGARRSCRNHENSMHAEQIIIILYIYIVCSMYLVLFSLVLYRTIVTVYTDNIVLYNYLWQINQIIHLLPVGCVTSARGKSVQKNREVSGVKLLDRAVSGTGSYLGVCLNVTLLIVGLLQYCVCCIRFGVMWCTCLMMLIIFPFLFFLSIGCCGAGVFGLIWCISLSLSLALPTSFNNIFFWG